jgi:hypothetical protein
MEKNIDTILYFCFLIIFSIQYGLILFSDHHKGNNCVDMHLKMYFMLDFTFDFYSYYYYTLCMFVNNMLRIEFKNKKMSKY